MNILSHSFIYILHIFSHASVAYIHMQAHVPRHTCPLACLYIGTCIHTHTQAWGDSDGAAIHRPISKVWIVCHVLLPWLVCGYLQILLSRLLELCWALPLSIATHFQNSLRMNESLQCLSSCHGMASVSIPSPSMWVIGPHVLFDMKGALKIIPSDLLNVQKTEAQRKIGICSRLPRKSEAELNLNPNLGPGLLWPFAPPKEDLPPQILIPLLVLPGTVQHSGYKWPWVSSDTLVPHRDQGVLLSSLWACPTALIPSCRPFKWINIPRSPGAQGNGARRWDGQTAEAVRAPEPPLSRKQRWLSHSINIFFSLHAYSVSCQVSISLTGIQTHDRHGGTEKNQSWGYHIPLGPTTATQCGKSRENSLEEHLPEQWISKQVWQS